MWFVIKRLSLGTVLIVAAAAVLLLTDWNRRHAGVSRVPRVAILQHASQPIIEDGVQGMLDGLAANGFVDGQTVSIRRFNAENDMPTANTIARAITTGEYQMVLTATTVSLQAVVNANLGGKAMHVFALVSDPFAAGVGLNRDQPLQHPRHLVGFGTMQPVVKTFELAQRMFPGLTSVGTVWNPAEANSEANVKLGREICRRLGIDLVEANVDSTSGVKEAASALIGRGVQALWIGGDVTVLTALDTVVAAARQAAIPVFTCIPGSAQRGTFFDLGANYREVGRIAGDLAAHLLHGADPTQIAIDNIMPEKLLINRAALAELKDPWQLPDDVLRNAELVGAAPTPATAVDSPTEGSTRPLAKQWKVDILEYVNVVDSEDAARGLRAGLTDSGLLEGRDYVVRLRNAQGDMPTLSTLVDAAQSEGADLLLTLSTPTLQAALQRARQLPIVFTFVADAAVAGAGRDNADHLPNVTGVPTQSPSDELIGAVRECLPQARRIGTLFVPAEVNSVFNKDKMSDAARRAGLELVAVPVNTSSEMSDAALALCEQPIDAVVQTGSNLTSVAFASITQAARRNHVPVFGALSGNLADGAAVVVARDYYDGGHAAGAMAARIMRGERPAAMPFQPLRTTKILIDLDAARAMGLAIPAALRQRATQIVGH